MGLHNAFDCLMQPGSSDSEDDIQQADVHANVDNVCDPEPHMMNEGIELERMISEFFGMADGLRARVMEDQFIPNRAGFENEMGDPGIGPQSHAANPGNNAVPNDDLRDTLLEEAMLPLFPGCTISKLGFQLVMMSLQHVHGVPNAFMDELFSFLKKDVLHRDNIMPGSRYACWSYLEKIGLTFKSIHVCGRGCILFWEETANLECCSKCGDSKYIPGSTSIPVKVMRWFPLIPRLQKMYRCIELSTLMKWHATHKSPDGLVRSVVDSKAWAHVSLLDPTFQVESRNIHLGLALDGMNPFSDMLLRYSVWPILLLNYNLPPWLTTKRFFVMMSILIPGRESCNSSNIDVYLEPLVKELQSLWVGVPTIDIGTGPNPDRFILRAILLWTINDYPAYGLVSGCAVKSYKGCPVCGPAVDSRYSVELKKKYLWAIEGI